MNILYGFILGLCANIFGFSLAFFIQWPIPKNVVDNFYPFRKFETNGRFYEFLGVKLFKNFLLTSGYNKVMNKNIRMGKHNELSLEKLEKLIFEMRQGELLHLIGWIIATLISIYFFQKGKLHFFLGITLLNIPLNLYPVLLQRYNRIRIRKFWEYFGPQNSRLTAGSTKTRNPEL